MVKTDYNFLSNKTQNFYHHNNNKKIKLFEFYQLCLFKNELNDRYNIRQTFYTNDFEILKYVDYAVTKKDYIKLIKMLPKHKYKTYPSSDLKIISLPSESDLISSTSELLENNNLFYDFAKF